MPVNLDALLDEITASIEDATRVKTATELELAGWETWWRAIFGDSLVDALAPHHREAVIWHWNSRMQQLAGIKPRNDAYFAPWSRGHLKCVSAGTEILMADGSRKPIEQVAAGDAVQCVNEKTGEITSRQVASQWNAGRKECVTVKTRSGWSLTATPDHHVWTFNGTFQWKKIGDIAPGDRIASPRRILSNTTSETRQDEEIRLLVYFLAEGNTTFGGTSFSANITSADDEIRDDAIACAAALGFEGRPMQAKYRISFRHGVRPWIASHGLAGKKAVNKRVPLWCFFLTPEHRAQFLAAWLDTDGFVGAQTCGITLANPGMIDDLRYIFLQHGIVGRVYKQSEIKAGAWGLYLDPSSFKHASTLPLRLKAARWKTLLNTPRYSLLDCYPQCITSNLPKGVNRMLRREISWKPSYTNPTVTRDKVARALAIIHIPLWHWLENADVWWDEVASIIPAGEHDTYDLEVEEHHNFIANGLVTHNSTLARRIAVADACLSKKGYCLYVGGTDDKVKGHALSMESLIASESIRKYYPSLARVRKSSMGSSKGWTQKFIYTDQGYIFHFVSLDKGVAGANIDNIRPTLIVPDDIDDRQDSPAVAQKRFEVLTTEVLPTKQEGTLFFFAQNVINRYSVMYRALKQTARILTNRFPTQPIPAIENLVTEERTVKGMIKDIVVSGTPTWHKYGLDRAQEDIDVFGLEAFLAECQHEVDQNKQGLILPEWNEKVHIISWSQFQSVFGVRHIPHHWRKYVGHDWGSIHPCVMSYVATSSANAVIPHVHFTWGITTFKQNTMPDETALALINRLMPSIDTSVVETRSKDEASRAIRADVTKWLQTEGANYDTWHMSHEARTVRDHYNITYGIPFAPCNPKAAGGVEQMRHFLRPDYSQPNPFKPGENGLAGWYFIVDDDQVEEARDDRGLKLLREQFPQWSWRNVGLTETGLQADKPMKVFDDIGNCLTGDTRVLTDRGEVPIVDVVIGDKVLTRYGWETVEMSAQTHSDIDVFTVELADGRTITGTAEHPFWVEGRGWTPLRDLCMDDMLYVCQTNVSRLTAFPTIGIQSQKTQRIGSIFNAISILKDKVSAFYTLISGNIITERFPRDITSIIKTVIPKTTITGTWSASPVRNMLPITANNEAEPLRDWRTWQQFSRFPVHGTQPKRGWLGIENTPNSRSTITSHMKRLASFAVSVLRQNCRGVASALQSVPFAPGKAFDWIGFPGNAWFVTRHIPLARITKRNIAASRVRSEGIEDKPSELSNVEFVRKNFERLALGKNTVQMVAVRRVFASGRAATYNLQVTNHPEFFANGILVHNSLMMLFAHFSLGPTPYTAEEKQEMALSKGLRREDIEKMTPNQADYALILREWELKQQQKNNKLGNNHWSGEILDTGDDFRAYWKE